MSQKSFVTASNSLQNISTECSIDRICPDKFKFNWPSEPKISKKKKSFTRLIFNLYEQKDFSDIVIEINEHKFPCNMLVLQSYSKFFQNYTKNEKQIKLSEIEAEVFEKIYQWMLSKEKRVERNGLVKMLMGAEYLQIDFLIQQCWSLIQNSKWFSEDQAFLLYKEARKCNYEMIKKIASQNVKKIFLTIVSTLDFVTLSVYEVIQFLQCDNIAVNSEIDAFYAAVRWLLYDWSARKKYLMDVMKCIRFGLIDTARIVILRQKNNNGQLNELLSNKELQKSLKEALNYAIYREKFEKCDFDCFNNFLMRFDYKLLFERNLIDDPYWHKRSERATYSFEDFLSYLNFIKTNALLHWATLETTLKLYTQNNKRKALAI